jgi:hypothetical protein
MRKKRRRKRKMKKKRSKLSLQSPVYHQKKLSHLLIIQIFY